MDSDSQVKVVGIVEAMRIIGNDRVPHFRHSEFDDCSALWPIDYGTPEGVGLAYGYRIAFGGRGDDHGIGGGNFAVGIVQRSDHGYDVRKSRFGISAFQLATAAAVSDKAYFKWPVENFGASKIDQTFKLFDTFQTSHGHVSTYTGTTRRNGRRGFGCQRLQPRNVHRVRSQIYTRCLRAEEVPQRCGHVRRYGNDPACAAIVATFAVATIVRPRQSVIGQTGKVAVYHCVMPCIPGGIYARPQYIVRHRCQALEPAYYDVVRR